MEQRWSKCGRRSRAGDGARAGAGRVVKQVKSDNSTKRKTCLCFENMVALKRAVWLKIWRFLKRTVGLKIIMVVLKRVARVSRR